MFTLNRIISTKRCWSQFCIDHCSHLCTYNYKWKLFFSPIAQDPVKIMCYQLSPSIKYDLGIILELVSSNGNVVKRSKLTVIRVPANCVGEEGTLRCELFTKKSEISEDDINQLKAKAIIFTRDPEKPFNPSPETLSLYSSYKMLFNHKESADIVVKASDGVELRVHKLPLMTRSSTFRTMFGIDMTEKQTGTVHIKDFDSKVLTELFRFIYYNEVEDIEEIVVELIKAAKRYEVDVLPEICAKTIIKNFQDLEIWNVLKLAHVYELQELLEFVASIFLANYKFYSQQEAWKKEQDFSLKSKVLECIEQLRQPYDEKYSLIFMEPSHLLVQSSSHDI